MRTIAISSWVVLLIPPKTNANVNANANLTLQAWALVVTEGRQDFRLYQLEKAHLGSMKMEQSRPIH
jgi:hypothetical protein